LFNPALAPAGSPVFKRVVSLFSLSLGAFALGTALAGAQVSSFGGNAQHTSLYTPPAQNINQIKWVTSIDLTNPGFLGHYGAPLITANNTVITPVVLSSTGVKVSAFDGATGAPKYDLATDWTFPAHNWLPEYQPCLSGNRLYYAGAGGTVYYVDNANTNSPSAPTQVCFYGLANYTGNSAGFNGSVFIDTPITADSAGNIFFGFRTQGTAPAPLNSTKSGYAKIDSSGNGTYVFVDTMTGDANISFDCHNTAPALSNDESKLYVVAKWNTNAYYGYLVALNTSDMSTTSKIFLKDPRNGNNAGILDDGTASPMVGPDGDVFLGIFANPYNGSRGFLGHFSGDLSVTKTPGGFGWDYTPGVVPASMIPSYNGPSSYLLFCKYNNYAGIGDGSGVNRVAVIDPNAIETDANASGGGLQIMREVQTVIGFTPDEENPSLPNAVREMCVNTTAVNPATGTVFFNSEDGHCYRWNLASNQVTQTLSLTGGFGEPYVPSAIGPDGTVYTLNGGQLFAMGGLSNDTVSMTSDHSDSRNAVLGTPITFTAAVTGNSPSGTVTFSDFTYSGFTQVTTPLGVATLDGTGHASVTAPALTAGGGFLGNHYITAQYSGDANNAAGSIVLVQKVHAFASSTALQAVGNPSPYGQPVVLTATVTGVGTTDIPSGQVTFLNDNKVIGQVPLDGTGNCSFTANGLLAGTRDLQAYYQSDTEFASSSNIQEVTITDGTTTSVGSAPNPSTFGQSVTFTATVTSSDAGAGTPTGSVVFTIDGVAGSPVSVDGSGQATYSTTALTVGTHTVTAAFTGSNGWSNSSGNGSNQSVTATTSTSESSSPNPSLSGQNVTFTATVTSGGGTPTGSVVFTIDGSAGSPVTVDGTGHAAYSTNGLSAASHTVSAAFTGSGGFGNSSGNGANQVVNSNGTTTTVASSPNPSNIGSSVTFTATVTSGSGTPTGSVIFTIDGSAGSPVTVDGTGHAAYSTSSLTLGSHTASAAFTGTGGWGNSSGSGANQVVNGGTSTAIGSNRNPSVIGQSVTFTATVTSTGTGTPAGSVTFKDGATTLATVALDGTGHAATSTSALTQASHSITANFVGTGGWQNSSNGLTQVVTADTTPPTIPQGVNANAGPGKGKVTVAWSASTDPDDAVNHYEVWRSNKVNGAFTLVASPTSLTYLDNAGANKTMYYYVIAVDSHNNKSAHSATVSATAPNHL
jgi:hypothetical protein